MRRSFSYRQRRLARVLGARLGGGPLSGALLRVVVVPPLWRRARGA